MGDLEKVVEIALDLWAERERKKNTVVFVDEWWHGSVLSVVGAAEDAVKCFQKVVEQRANMPDGLFDACLRLSHLVQFFRAVDADAALRNEGKVARNRGEVH